MENRLNKRSRISRLAHDVDPRRLHRQLKPDTSESHGTVIMFKSSSILIALFSSRRKHALAMELRPNTVHAIRVRCRPDRIVGHPVNLPAAIADPADWEQELGYS